MVGIADEMVSGSESASLVTGHLGFFVEPLDGAIVDGHMKPIRMFSSWLRIIQANLRMGSNRECVAHQTNALGTS
jgi:hypothetical protein